MSEGEGVSITVGDVMSRKVIVVGGDVSVEEAARQMSRLDSEGLGCVLVEVDGRVEGILTERDIVCRVIARGLPAANTRVRDVMSKPVVGVTPDTPVEDALKIMSQRNIRRLPVVEGDRLVGIVTLTHVARAISAEYEELNALLLEALSSQGSSTLEPFA